ECRVVRHQPEIVGAGLDLAQVHRPNRPVLDWQVVLLPGTVVGDRQRVGHLVVCLWIGCVVGLVGVGQGLGGDGIGSVGPARQILQFAALAAERAPRRFHRMPPAEDAEWLHGRYFILRNRAPRVAARTARRSEAGRVGIWPDFDTPRMTRSHFRLSPAWWRTSLAETMKMTSSATLVAWSPIRSRWRETRIRSSAG